MAMLRHAAIDRDGCVVHRATSGVRNGRAHHLEATGTEGPIGLQGGGELAGS
jgi:hypothetical protein